MKVENDFIPLQIKLDFFGIGITKSKVELL